MHARLQDRGGSGNSDSVISGRLASPKPSEGGEPEEHGNEKNETLEGSAVLKPIKVDLRPSYRILSAQKWGRGQSSEVAS